MVESTVDYTLPEEDELEIDDQLELPFVALLAFEGVETSDGRSFAVGALTPRELPLPLMYQRVNSSGHEGSVVVGIIAEVFRVEGSGEVRARGYLNPRAPEFEEVVDGIIFGSIRGVSIDVGYADGEVLRDANGDPVGMHFTEGELMGATIVAKPAFSNTYIALGDYFDDEVTTDALAASADCGCTEITVEDYSEDQIEEFAPGTRDGPGWVTNPKETQRLRRYWTRGEGAAKIRWGQPGDFNRCRKQLAKYVNPAFLAGTCANLHKVALGTWPGQHGRTASAEATTVLTAAAPLPTLPAEWFKNPNLDGPTSLKITNEGRVYGHLAAWGVCHIGIPGTCVTAPSSRSNYTYFHTGIVETEEGPVNVGSLTMGIGHPSLRVSAAAATAHYDQSDAVFADVVVGEDEHGIWFSGAIRSGISEDKIRELRATAKLSGDWRPIRGELELVGVVAVGVPGFPIPEARFSVADGHQLALVAAGIVAEDKTVDPELAKARETFNKIEEEIRASMISDARRMLGEFDGM